MSNIVKQSLPTLIHDKWPHKRQRDKAIRFLYLWSARSAEIKNRLHKKSLKEISHITFPTKLARRVLGRDYNDYIHFFTDNNILEPMYVGQTRAGHDIVAFKPTKALLKQSQDWKHLKQQAISIYEDYLNDTSVDDDYAAYLHETIEITTYNNKSIPQVVVKDTFAGRYYCYTTNIKSSLRLKNVRIGGEPIVSIDIVQSQIEHLYKVLLRSYPKLKDSDFAKFIRGGGVLYEEFQETFNIKKRDDAKDIVFEALFGKCGNKVQKMLFYLFPELEIPLSEIKGIHDPENPSFKIHANLAYKLQKSEVKLLQHVMEELVDEGIPFLTVHDSIEVPISKADEAHSIMQEVLDFHLPEAKLKQKVHPMHQRAIQKNECRVNNILYSQVT